VSDETLPSWYDADGMSAWVRGMAEAFSCRIRLSDERGRHLCTHGEGKGRWWKKTLDINGKRRALLEIKPPPSESVIEAVSNGITTFKALAEARNSVADLVEMNARQWAELTVLYRSSRLLQGGLGRDEIARYLLDQLSEVLPGCDFFLQCLFSEEPEPHILTFGDPGDCREIARWGFELDRGVLIGSESELKRLGCPARKIPSSRQLIVTPIACGGVRFGTIVCSGSGLSSQHLKLAGLLAGQAGQAFANDRLVKEATEHERLQHELGLAARIQESILPDGEYRQGCFQVCSYCKPAAWVGGDTYLLEVLGNGSVLAGVADVSGHGISAALLINAFVSHLEALSRNLQAPEVLLAVINDLITSRVRDMGMFVTGVLLRLDPSGAAWVSSAGHPPVVMVDRLGQIKVVDEGGIPLGILPDQEYPLIEIPLEKGEILLVFSDGLMEARNPRGHMYGLDRICVSLKKNQHAARDARKILSGLLDDVRLFCGERPFDDDLTIQLIRRT